MAKVWYIHYDVYNFATQEEKVCTIRATSEEEKRMFEKNLSERGYCYYTKEVQE